MGTAVAFSRSANVRAQGDDMATAKKAAKKTVAGKTPATARAAMSDATLLLTRDHAEVKKLFKEYEKLADAEADGEERQALAEQICAMLTVHATVEEEIFYPAAREAEVESDLLDEAEVEHASAKDLIAPRT
jgi:hemerythrin superfamily protein